MEAAALSLLEEVVERLIPPAARDAVLGDLRESYADPRHYLWEVLKAAPNYVWRGSPPRRARPTRSVASPGRLDRSSRAVTRRGLT